MTPEEIIEEVKGMDILDILSEVKNWDFEDIYELKDYLDELKSRGESNQVDMTNLPCAEKYLERVNIITESPYVVIWTCDRYGRCLCGPAADEVEDIVKLEEGARGEN